MFLHLGCKVGVIGADFALRIGTRIEFVLGLVVALGFPRDRVDGGNLATLRMYKTLSTTF